MQGVIYVFDGFLLDEAERRLQKDGVEIQLPPRVFDVLRILVARHGTLVPYDELMDAVWGETFVEEGNLRYSVHSLRKALGSGLIETVAKKGYRFTADVRAIEREEFITQYVGGTAVVETAPLQNGSQAAEHNGSGLAGKWLPISLVAACLVIVAALFVISRGPGESADVPPLSTLAVAPFEIVSDDSTRSAIFQKGVADSLSFNLGRIRGLRVSPGETTDNTTNSSGPETRIAYETLRGSIRLEGTTARVSFTITSHSAAQAPAAKTFTAEPVEGIGIEEVVALRIARLVDNRLTVKRDEQVAVGGELDAETRSMFLLSQRIPRESDLNRWPEVTALLEKVTERAPNWPVGFAKLAEAVVLSSENADCTKAMEIADLAIELDQNSSDAYFVKARCYVRSLDWQNAELAFKLAIRADNTNSRALFEYGAMLGHQRRFAEAEIRVRRGLELEPFAPYYNYLVARHYLHDKKWNDAIRFSRLAVAIEPGYFMAEKNLYWVYVNQGRYDLVLDAAYPELSAEQRADHPTAKFLVAGDVPGYWRAILDERQSKGDQKPNPITFAVYHAMMGDRELALTELTRAVDESSTERPRINVEPVFDPLRSDPRFAVLIERLGLNRGLDNWDERRTTFDN